MALPLEASSLSSITQLAENPPKYPREPSGNKREPLVLYIARVPGTKDIILTTMKPRLKNVTAEDVMNSLYYLHLDLPSDDILREEALLVEDIEHTLKLTKCPETPESLVRDSDVTQLPELSLKFHQQLRPSSDTLNSKYRPNTEIEMAQSGSVRLRPPPPQRPAPTIEISPTRRPLGPRPLIPHSYTSKQLFPGDENIPIGSNASSVTSVSDYVTKLSEAKRSSQDGPQTDVQIHDQNLGFESISDQFSVQNPFVVTLIRRDPTSAAQWNIGKIRANPLEVRSSSNTRPKTVFERKCSSISVHLTTSGYSQFRANSLPFDTGEGGRNQRPQTPIDAAFEREVRLAASGFRTWKSREHRRGLSDQSAVRKRTYTRESLGELGRENEELRQGSRANLVEVPDCGFLSPWNSCCNFSTGSNGRTVKCKHTMPNSTSANKVSELRFNLPSIITSGGTTKSLTSSPASENKQRGISKVRGSSSLSASFQNSRPRSQPPHPTSYSAMYPSSDEGGDDDDDDGDGGGDIESRNALSDQVDPLSLGREKAGGGIRGKRAKLGKLIVYDEGLKMLDLVVAANMGVWWTIWDK